MEASETNLKRDRSEKSRKVKNEMRNIKRRRVRDRIRENEKKEKIKIDKNRNKINEKKKILEKDFRNGFHSVQNLICNHL